MRYGMRKPHGLKLRRYADRMIDLNKYFYVFPGGKASDKICEMELGDLFLTACLTAVACRVMLKGLIEKPLL